MSLAHKLYKIGLLTSKDEIRDIIEVKEFNDLGSYTTVQIDFKDGKVTVNNNAVDINRTIFTKKIGGTSNSYYLYPNFEYLVKKSEKKDLYKKFKSSIHTLENSILAYADEKYHEPVRLLIKYIQDYKEDVLHLKDYPNGNYFLILTIGGKNFTQLMPEIFDNYYKFFVKPHILEEKKKKIDGKDQKAITRLVERDANLKKDFITNQTIFFGYDPDIKFFTYDNYHDNLKPDIINKLPMSKETAIAIKKGWMYAITHLKFYHKGLEYIIIPSMVNFNRDVYQNMLRYLRNSNDIQMTASKEESFLRRLSKQIEEFNSNGIALDILFTEVNMTNLSVKIFSTLEDVLPSRIMHVVQQMKNSDIVDSIKQEDKHKINLRDYFSRKELFAIVTKNKSAMQNTILQEKIYLAKLLLGYEKVDLKTLLKKFEFEREFNFEQKKRLTDHGIKSWIEYPNSFVKKEDNILHFLQSIDAINNKGVRYGQ